LIEALVHIATAIKLDSNNPEFHCKKANIMKRLRVNAEAKKDIVNAEQLCAKGRYLSKNRPDNIVSVVHDQF
jgi:Flp pilus assembly protein TadD